MSDFDEIRSALRERADLNARLSLIPCEGTHQIKEVNGRRYLEGTDAEIITAFLKKNCRKTF